MECRAPVESRLFCCISSFECILAKANVFFIIVIETLIHWKPSYLLNAPQKNRPQAEVTFFQQMQTFTQIRRWDQRCQDRWFRLTKWDDYFRVIFSHFWSENHFWGSWSSIENLLEPKKQTTITKVRLSKCMWKAL